MASVLIAAIPDLMRQALADALQRDGHGVVLASDGRCALREHHAQPADVLVTDLLLPEVDGLDLIRRVTRVQPGIRIVALCGGQYSAVYLHAAKILGAGWLVGEPLDFETLIRTVRDALAEPAAVPARRDSAPGGPAGSESNAQGREETERNLRLVDGA